MTPFCSQQPIVAQCTPVGSGALALVRLSGPGALTVATRMSVLAGAKKLDTASSHTIHFGRVLDDNGKTIDQVLFLVMHAPRTFTGYDTVEVTCHNNQFIVEAIVQQAIKQGARLAQPGEFSKQAFLNSKIDLMQAEAINELITAHTQEAIKKSLEQLDGSFSQWAKTIQQQLLQALALCEASFEFLDDESVDFDDDIRSIVRNVLACIKAAQAQYVQQRHLKDGIRIALIGQVNAGKSSLFNTLIRQERAIVTEIAGTTRDVIESGVYSDGCYVTFIDTAGLRHTDDHIEQEGIKRSFQEACKADIILLLVDSSRSMQSDERTMYDQLVREYGYKVIALATKSDQKQYDVVIDGVAVLPISVVSDENIASLREFITQKRCELLENCTMPFLINQRQCRLIQGLERDLQELLGSIATDVQHELLAIHLKDALAAFAELTGTTISDQSVDEIFKQFCVGK